MLFLSSALLLGLATPPCVADVPPSVGNSPPSIADSSPGVADTPPPGAIDAPPTPTVVFPPPPDIPRIQYLRSIRDNEAFAQKKGWLRKVWDTLAGEEETVRLVRPHGVEATSDLVLVCDPGAGYVHAFKTRGPDYFRIPKEGGLPSPIDAAIDPEGNIYVTDSKLAVVVSYDPNGNLLHRFEGEFLRPTGITYHGATGRLYVVDTMTHQVFVHTPDGKRIGAFGGRGTGEGAFNFPTAIAVDGDGNLYITDAMNFRVQVFGPDGEFRHMFGKAGDGTGDFSKPKGIAADSDGNVFVVDALFDAVQIFDPMGTLLLAFGHSGQAPGEFWLPAGIDADEEDRIYVADSYNNRVQVFQYIKE
jgi:DNA-binding beta-propeller fold protein YncE